MRFVNWLIYVSLCAFAVGVSTWVVSVIYVAGLEKETNSSVDIHFKSEHKNIVSLIEKKSESILVNSISENGNVTYSNGHIKFINGKWVVVEAHGIFSVSDSTGTVSNYGIGNKSKLENAFFKVSLCPANEYKITFNKIKENNVAFLSAIVLNYNSDSKIYIKRKGYNDYREIEGVNVVHGAKGYVIRGFDPLIQFCDIYFKLPKNSVKIQSKNFFNCLSKDGLVDDDIRQAITLSFDYGIGDIALVITVISVLISVLLPSVDSYCDPFVFGKSCSRHLCFIILGLAVVLLMLAISVLYYFTINYQDFSVVNFMGMDLNQKLSLIWIWFKPLAFPIGMIGSVITVNAFVRRQG